MSLPKYFKGSDGFCYAATEQLAKLTHLTPWDGDVDARGFAVDAPQKRTRRPRGDTLVQTTAESVAGASE